MLLEMLSIDVYSLRLSLFFLCCTRVIFIHHFLFVKNIAVLFSLKNQRMDTYVKIESIHTGIFSSQIGIMSNLCEKEFCKWPFLLTEQVVL